MSWSTIAVITPNEYISLCGQLVNIHEIETIKLNQNGNIFYFTKRNTSSLTEHNVSFHLNKETGQTTHIENEKPEQENKD